MHKIMHKIFFIILLSLFGVGCSILMKANIKNEGSSQIFITQPAFNNMAWHIKAAAIVEINWTARCLIVVDSGVQYYFQAFPIPAEAHRSGKLGAKINATYNRGNMVLATAQGNGYPLPKLSECPNA